VVRGKAAVHSFDARKLIGELAWLAGSQMWRRWKFERSDRIAFNLVWFFVIFVAALAVFFLRGCT